MRDALVACALLLCACTRNEPAHQVESVRAPSDDGASAPSGSKSEAAAQATPQGPLALELVVEQGAEGVGLHVLSRASDVVELAELVAARRADGGEADEQALRLRLDCQQHGCVKLGPGSELVAPSWLGLVEGERCDARFRPKQPGEYVLTVRSCDGKRSSEIRFHWDGS